MEYCEVTNKVCYSYRRAHEILKMCRYNKYKTNKKIPKRSYYCKHCKQYHLSSKTYDTF